MLDLHHMSELPQIRVYCFSSCYNLFQGGVLNDSLLSEKDV